MKKIAVIGGGLAGLTATYYLKDIMPSNQVHLFEKENYLGGRIKSIQWNDMFIDIGAQFLTNEDKEAFTLLKKLNLTKSIKKINMDFSVHNGEKLVAGSLQPLLKTYDISTQNEIDKLLLHLKKFEQIINTDISMNDLMEYTTKSFSTWYYENVGTDMLWFYDSYIRALSFSNCHEVSALYGLIIVLALLGQCYSFPKGLSEIINKLQKEVPSVNLKKKYDVTSVETYPDKIKINNQDFSHIIFATPFNNVKKFIKEFKELNIHYTSCKYILLELKKKHWNYGYAILPSTSSPISYISNEGCKYTKNSKTDILGVIFPYTDQQNENDERKILKKVIDELYTLIGITESNILRCKIFDWKYALPLCSPEFHETIGKLQTLIPEHISLCGDYMGLPSVDGAIESARMVVDTIT